MRGHGLKLLIASALLLSVSARAQAPSVTDTLAALADDDIRVATEAMREFAAVGAEAYGMEGLPVIRSAIDAESADLQLLGLASLWRLSHIDHDMVAEERLLRRVRELLREGSTKVSIEAARVLANPLASVPMSARVALIDKAADSSVDLPTRAQILAMVPVELASEKGVEDKLLSLLRRGPAEIRYQAVLQVSRWPTPPLAALPVAMQLAQTPRYFGDVNLVLAVGRFGGAAKPYVPLLRTISETLRYQRSLPAELRTVNVAWQEDGTRVLFESAGMISTLEEVIAALSVK